MKSKVKQLFGSIAVVVACLSVPHAAAEELIADQSNPALWLSVETVGLQPPWAYVTFKTAGGSVLPAGTNCLWGDFFIDLTVPGAKLMHQQLLLARTTGKRISRIGYSTVAVAGYTVPQCNISLMSQSE